MLWEIGNSGKTFCLGIYCKDPLLDIITFFFVLCYRPEIIQKLLDKMLNSSEQIESSIVGGISVLLTLLEPPPR